MTDAELTILSIVAEGPRYGYEIQQVIDERGMREWLTIGFASIYYILNRLEKHNMITSRLRVDGGGPARKVYEITEAGQGVLQTAISELLRQPRSLGSGFELGLVNLTALKPKQAYRVLCHHRDELTERLHAVEKSWQRHQEDDIPDSEDHFYALYTHSIAVMRAELDWLIAFLERWRISYPDVEEHGDSKTYSASEARTDVHRPTLNADPAKMIQRLKKASPPRGD